MGISDIPGYWYQLGYWMGLSGDDDGRADHPDYAVGVRDGLHDRKLKEPTLAELREANPYDKHPDFSPWRNAKTS